MRFRLDFIPFQYQFTWILRIGTASLYQTQATG